MEQEKKDVFFMALAIEQAQKAKGITNPNPPVGAILEKQGKILWSGFHQGVGCPHAEVEVIQAAKEKMFHVEQSQTTLYVTLEPCSTEGRTGACTEAILKAGIQRVRYGCDDPNPLHQGCATQILRAAGVDCLGGILEEETSRLIRGFQMCQQEGRPWVIAKWAMTLDGRLDRAEGEPSQITGAEAQKEVMSLREEVDAIFVGARTAITDNPRLTIREGTMEGKKQPYRVILGDTERAFPEDLHLFSDEHRERTLVRSESDLLKVLQELTKKGCCTVLVEGGGKTHARFFEEELVDEVVCSLGNLVSGGTVPAIGGFGFAEGPKAFEIEETKPLNDALWVRGIIKRQPRQLSG